jgi:tetratricopeptide (TPR) repeat protein
LKLWLRLISLLAASSAFADGSTTIFDAGRQAQPWLSLSTDARGAGMAEASVASSDDLRALRNNPGGLSLLNEPELLFNHNEWNTAMGFRQEYLAWGRRLGDGGFGLGLNYFSFGNFDDRDLSGAVIGSSSDSGYAASLGWGSAFWSDQVHLGAALEAAQQSLSGQSSSLYTLSLGGLYEASPGLWLGAAATGLGLSAQGGQAPSAVQIGANWQVFSRSLGLNAEWSKPTLGNSSERLGAEWKILGDYALRAGWRFGSQGEPDQGFSLGAGAKLGAFQIDYAYVPYGELTQAHRVSLSLDLSEPIFGGNIIVEGTGVTQNAQAEYTDGKASYDKREWYEAKVSLSRALKINPAMHQAAEIKGMLEDIEKKIAADRSHGLSSEQKARIQKHLSSAKSLIEEGELLKARKDVAAVLEFDPQQKDALALQKQVNDRMGTRVKSLKQEAFSALSQDDIVTAVIKFRGVLKIDDTDPDATGTLRKLSSRIRMETKKLHRQGIDLYVTAEIEKAIKIWEKAVELDPSDPDSIKRDIDKARKLLQLRAGS